VNDTFFFGDLRGVLVQSAAMDTNWYAGVALAVAVAACIPRGMQHSMRKATRMFTPRAMQVLALARRAATGMHHAYTGTEHLLIGMIMLNQGMAVEILKKQGLDLEKIRKEVERLVGPGPESAKGSDVPYTLGVKETVRLAMREAKSMKHSYVGTEHILLALMAGDEGMAVQVFKESKVDIAAARNQILTAFSQQAK
jgi:ATP-dependent Clp protease ATP-binding subunit ClpC